MPSPGSARSPTPIPAALVYGDRAIAAAMSLYWERRIGAYVASWLRSRRSAAIRPFLRRVAPPLVEGVLKTMAEDRAQRYAGGTPARRCVIPDGDAPGIYNEADAVTFWGATAVMAPSWENSVTLRSSELASHYEPGAIIGRVSPTPLLMIVAQKDDVTPADLALAAYNQALKPKKLHLIEGGHFDPYDREFTEASTTALAWFRAHLIGRELLP